MYNLKSLLSRVIQQSDDLVIVFDYQDAKGAVSRRVVSPYRLLGETHFLGLCLTREEPRQFQMSRCRNVRIDLAMNYVMPVVFSLQSAVA
jgi:predicted DNA-binding transcriptional regulator YafY